MTAPALPILPTTVVGSYAIPAWLWAAWEKIEAGGFGGMDVAETENDAVAVPVSSVTGTPRATSRRPYSSRSSGPHRARIVPRTPSSCRAWAA